MPRLTHFRLHLLLCTFGFEGTRGKSFLYIKRPSKSYIDGVPVELGDAEAGWKLLMTVLSRDRCWVNDFVCRMWSDSLPSYWAKPLHKMYKEYYYYYLEFEVFTAATMNNVVFWEVSPCGSCKNRRFRVQYRLHLQGKKIRERWLTVC
jgi:hypothetical protein